jgi:hypothetical protein
MDVEFNLPRRVADNLVDLVPAVIVPLSSGTIVTLFADGAAYIDVGTLLAYNQEVTGKAEFNPDGSTAYVSFGHAYYSRPLSARVIAAATKKAGRLVREARRSLTTVSRGQTRRARS